MFKSQVNSQNASNRCLTVLMVVLTSLLSNSASYGTDTTKPFPFLDVIEKMDWPGPNGSQVEGTLVCTYPEFVTVLAGDKQYKISRRSLDAKQLQIVKMLDEEIAYLKIPIAPNWRAQKLDEKSVISYRVIRVNESPVNPELAEFTTVVRHGLVGQFAQGKIQGESSKS